MGRSNWSTDDTRREILFIALAAVDWYQTSYGLAKKENFRESNPLLGTKPTQGEINVVIGLGVLAHVLVAYVLPPKWRRDFQIVTIGIEGYVVTTNHFILRSDP